MCTHTHAHACTHTHAHTHFHTHTSKHNRDIHTHKVEVYFEDVINFFFSFLFLCSGLFSIRSETSTTDFSIKNSVLEATFSGETGLLKVSALAV